MSYLVRLWIAVIIGIGSGPIPIRGGSAERRQDAAIGNPGGSYGSDRFVPSKTCLTQAQCDEQRKREGFADDRYYVGDL